MPSNRFELIAVILSLTIIISITLPTASALTPRDVSIIKDYIITDKYSGGQRVCGDHLCSVSEWNTMKHALQTHMHKSITCQDLKKWKACETVATQKP